MPQTTAELIGTPANASPKDVNEAITVGNKATGGGSTIPVGRVAFETSAGTWAIGAAGSTGRFGVVPKLDPKNTDTSPTLQVVTQKNAEIYVEGNSAVKPGWFVVCDAAGKVKARAGEAIDACVGHYEGHYGEGRGHGSKSTDGAAGEAWRIKLI
jgi:hypothetical protein